KGSSGCAVAVPAGDAGRARGLRRAGRTEGAGGAEASSDVVGALGSGAGSAEAGAGGGGSGEEVAALGTLVPLAALGSGGAARARQTAAPPATATTASTAAMRPRPSDLPVNGPVSGSRCVVAAVHLS